MIETTRFEDVTQIRMSREIGGVPVYWVASYLIDDSIYLMPNSAIFAKWDILTV